MNKKLLASILSITFFLSPVSIYADEKDDRIAELESMVAELQNEIDALKEKYEPEDVEEGTKEEKNVVKCRDYTFTLKSAKQCDYLPGYFDDEVPEQEGYVFLLLEIEANNESKANGYINNFYSAGYVDGYALDPSILIAVNHEEFVGDIASGRKRLGTVTFEVPNDWQEFEYVYNDRSDNIDVSFIITPDDLTE